MGGDWRQYVSRRQLEHGLYRLLEAVCIRVLASLLPFEQCCMNRIYLEVPATMGCPDQQRGCRALCFVEVAVQDALRVGNHGTATKLRGWRKSGLQDEPSYAFSSLMNRWRPVFNVSARNILVINECDNMLVLEGKQLIT